MATDPLAGASEILIETIGKPAYVASDGLVVSQASTTDIIKAINHIASTAAATNSNSRRGLRFNRLSPDGAVNSCRASRSFNRI